MKNRKCRGLDCAWCMSIECPNEKERKMTDKEQINDLLKNSDKNFNENFTQEKEQIIIDGVNVKDCRRRIGKNSYCRYFKRLCSDNNVNCVWKQLARKTAECEELKRQDYKNLKIIHNDFNQIKSLRAECARYRNALEEIEKVCRADIHTFADGTQLRYDSLDKILDIISRAKGKVNDIIRGV